MLEPYVTLKELAEEFGRDRTVVRRWILKHPQLKYEVSILRIRPPGSPGGNPWHAVSIKDAEYIMQVRKEEGFSLDGSTIASSTSMGSFYAVQPIPEFDEYRIKLGFALDAKQRLDTYRAICPKALILRAWPCQPIWERTAIVSISREGCVALGQELFQCDNVDALLDRGDAFFKLMPQSIS